jgi:hypothetical protein
MNGPLGTDGRAVGTRAGACDKKTGTFVTEENPMTAHRTPYGFSVSIDADSADELVVAALKDTLEHLRLQSKLWGDQLELMEAIGTVLNYYEPWSKEVQPDERK